MTAPMARTTPNDARGLGRRLRLARHPAAVVGLILLAVIVTIALIGPYVAPFSPTAVADLPFATPDMHHWLGTDELGRDVLSRVLNGGQSLLGLSVLATAVAYAIGLPAGLAAGYTRSRTTNSIIMRGVDVLLSFPPPLLLLVVATGANSNIWAMVLAVGLVLAAPLTRIVRAGTLDVAQRAYVEAAVARGEHTGRILRREVLPNILSVIFADVGLRLSYAVLLIASVNFLGVGLQPPSSDWGLMIAENRQGLNLNPWMVIVPAMLVAIITVSINLVADGIARTLGTSIERAR